MFLFKILTGVDGLNFKLERKPILLLKFTFQNLMGLSSNFTYERKSQVLTEKYVHHEKTVQIKRMTIDMKMSQLSILISKSMR